MGQKKDVAFCVDLSCLYNAKSLIIEVKILFAKYEYSLMHFTYRGVQSIAQNQVKRENNYTFISVNAYSKRYCNCKNIEFYFCTVLYHFICRIMHRTWFVCVIKVL